MGPVYIGLLLLVVYLIFRCLRYFYNLRRTLHTHNLQCKGTIGELEQKNKNFAAKIEKLEKENQKLYKKNLENEEMRSTFITTAKERDALDGKGLTDWSIDRLQNLLQRQKKAYTNVKKLIDQAKLQQIQQANQIKEEKLCVICLEETKNTLLVPCGHLATCQSCTKELRNCPMCRTKIDQVHKVFQ